MLDKVSATETALPGTVSVPVAVPSALGATDSAMAQVAAGAKEEPAHPSAVIDHPGALTSVAVAGVSGASPVFDSVTVVLAEVSTRTVPASAEAGPLRTPSRPVPDSVPLNTVPGVGSPEGLETVAVRRPAALGAKRTVAVHDSPTSRVAAVQLDDTTE